MEEQQDFFSQEESNVPRFSGDRDFLTTLDSIIFNAHDHLITGNLPEYHAALASWYLEVFPVADQQKNLTVSLPGRDKKMSWGEVTKELNQLIDDEEMPFKFRDLKKLHMILNVVTHRSKLRIKGKARQMASVLKSR